MIAKKIDHEIRSAGLFFGAGTVAALGLGPLYATLSAVLRRAFAGEGTRRRRPPMNVNSGRGFVFVSHVGTVHPSGFLPMDAGNVREQPLTQIYRDSPLFVDLRTPSKFSGKCGWCEYNEVCGGSRSRAYALTGDPLASDPWCAYEPQQPAAVP
jgi:radical SAM protein with 4Fe4S-binding SPASM domain